MKKSLFVIVFLLPVFFSLNSVRAVYFAKNKVLLYENGKRITDDSVIHDRGYQSPVCQNGECLIGQQYDTVTFYKTGQNNILNYDEWIDNWYISRPGCEGFATSKEAISRALEEWRNSDKYKETQKMVEQTNDVSERGRLWDELEPAKNDFLKMKGFDFIDNPVCKQINFSDYENVYLTDIKNNSIYFVTFDLPMPVGGEGCGSPGCIGGRIGNDRTLIVDLKKQTITESNNPFLSRNNILQTFEYFICLIKNLFGKSC